MTASNIDFSVLPLEIVVVLFRQSGLQSSDIIHLSMVNNATHTLHKQTDFWKYLYFSEFNVLPLHVDDWQKMVISRLSKWYPTYSDATHVSNLNDYMTAKQTESRGISLSSTRTSSLFNYCGTWQLKAGILNPIPLMVEQNPVMYYELMVEDVGNRQGIGIGLIIKGAKINHHMTGWEPGSFGCHSDDGNIYFNNSEGIMQCKSVPFGPSWDSVGTTVGCGYNFQLRQLFYTINGKFIGNAFTIPQELKIGEFSPIVTITSRNASVLVNLGQSPFQFNVDQYILGNNVQKAEFLPSVRNVDGYNMKPEDIQKWKECGGQGMIEPFVPEPEEKPTEHMNLGTENSNEDDEDEGDEDF